MLSQNNDDEYAELVLQSKILLILLKFSVSQGREDR